MGNSRKAGKEQYSGRAPGAILLATEGGGIRGRQDSLKLLDMNRAAECLRQARSARRRGPAARTKSLKKGGVENGLYCGAIIERAGPGVEVSDGGGTRAQRWWKRTTLWAATFS